MAFKGKHKIQDRWEQEVLDTCRGSPLVFKIQREDGKGKIRILHRNLLLPLRTKIPEEEMESSSNPGSSQVADPAEEPFPQEVNNPEEEEESQLEPQSDEPSVSTKPWTRSQGPPLATAGSVFISKCVTDDWYSECFGDWVYPTLTNRMMDCFTSFWEDVKLLYYNQ